jgi:DNA-directed RNA polymerase subunit E'/Rpb7
MFQLRFVEKLSRPMDIQRKEEVYKEFKRKFIILHQLLDKTKKDTNKETESTQSRNKSLNSNKVVRQKILKQDIKKIEGKYSEVGQPLRSFSLTAALSTTPRWRGCTIFH